MSSVIDGTKPVTFATAWSRTAMIDGWLTEAEAKLLFESAMALPEDATIVEVGSYRGRSTSLLAQTGRRVVAVDPLVKGFGQGNGMNVSDHDDGKLQSVIDRYPNTEWIRAHSYECIPLESVDMLYIDGDH